MTAQRRHTIPATPAPGRARPASSAGPAAGELPGGPVRTCIGCRERDAKQALVRVARAGGASPRIDVDVEARRPGRGAYVHLRRDCVERALAKGNLGRALRTRADRSHTTALRQSLFALLAPGSPGNLPRSGQPAEPVTASESSIHSPDQHPADLSACSPAPAQPTPSTSPADRMSRPNSEITSANPAPVASDRATTELTRPAPPFVDEHRQARGQR